MTITRSKSIFEKLSSSEEEKKTNFNLSLKRIPRKIKLFSLRRTQRDADVDVDADTSSDAFLRRSDAAMKSVENEFN